MKKRNQFITDNHKLIYQFAHDNNLNLTEYYDILAIGLIKAADTFNKEKGFTFATYAFSVMKNEYLMELRKKKKDRLNYALSLENLAVDDIPFIELLRGDEDIKGKYSDDIIRILNLLEKDELIIVTYIMKDYTQRQIALKMNTTQSNISRKLKIIKKKYSQLLEGGTTKWKK